MALTLQVNQDELEQFCRQRVIEQLWVFGSALRGALSTHSDLDVLVAYRMGARKSLFDLVDDRDAFQELLGASRKIDWVPIGSLRPWLRDEVLKEAQPLAHVA
jgi:predicted nucleotidyltransferase